MGYRDMPTVCEHGVEVYAGDFGPCQDCDEHGEDRCPNYVACPDCDAEFEAAQREAIAHQAVVRAAIAWRTNVVVPTDSPSPLTHSRALVAAVDALLALTRRPSTEGDTE